MEECENLEKCRFVKEFRDNPNYKLALEGFVNHYCKGDKQEDCVRKKISKELGGPDKVPDNMMPNGRALPGTSDSDWPDNVKQILTYT